MQYAILLGLALFYGFAFEEFYAGDLPHRPGGVRTFPLLTFAGTALYLIEPRFALAFIAGLAVLGSWLFSYVRADLEIVGQRVEAHFIIPSCVLLAYVLGPITLTQPLWFSVAFVVGIVLLIGSRKLLHDFAQRVPVSEVLTLGQFLLLVGVVLPLLYNAPHIPYTHITPFKVWLAVVAVSTLSYASYVLQRYVYPQSGVLLAAVLGGLYSSTATTVVLARTAREEGMTRELAGGIVAATAMMYVRMAVMVSLFNGALAGAVALPLVALGAIALVLAFVLVRSGPRSAPRDVTPKNPLQLGTAVIFALLMIVISILSAWVQAHLGSRGVLALAAVVGITDIDPFVLSIAQSNMAAIGLGTATTAILVASSSNNVLKSIYAFAFSRRRESWLPVSALLVLSALGLGWAWTISR